jgi:transmembrane sensor
MNAAPDKALNAIRDTAAEWVARLGAQEISASDKTDFANWLRASPVHLGEYLRAEAAWQALDSAVGHDTCDIAELLRTADTNIVALAPVSVGGGTEPRRRKLKFDSAAAMAAAVAVIITGAVLAPRYIDRLNPNLYTTEVGEQRRIVLSEGSAVELNTRSRIEVRLTAGARDIRLREGEAFFDVAPDPARPFRVLTDTGVVRAVGTQFNVYRKPGRTDVTVIQGRIAVTHADAATIHNRPVELGAGASIRLAADEAITSTDVSAENAIAWRQRRLIFEDATLAAAAAEFNRYNRRQILIEDAVLAAEHISGTFDADKPQGLIRFLEQGGEFRSIQLSPTAVRLTKQQ